MCGSHPSSRRLQGVSERTPGRFRTLARGDDRPASSRARVQVRRVGCGTTGGSRPARRGSGAAGSARSTRVVRRGARSHPGPPDGEPVRWRAAEALAEELVESAELVIADGLQVGKIGELDTGNRSAWRVRAPRMSAPLERMRCADHRKEPRVAVAALGPLRRPLASRIAGHLFRGRRLGGPLRALPRAPGFAVRGGRDGRAPPPAALAEVAHGVGPPQLAYGGEVAGHGRLIRSDSRSDGRLSLAAQVERGHLRAPCRDVRLSHHLRVAGHMHSTIMHRCHRTTDGSHSGGSTSSAPTTGTQRISIAGQQSQNPPKNI